MATQLDNEKNYAFDAQSFQENLFPHYRKLLGDFKKLSKSFVLFHLSFFTLILLEILAFAFLFVSLFQSTFIALTLGCIILTCFSYFVLLFYFHAKRPEELAALCRGFLTSCRGVISIPKGEPEHHLSIAHALIRLSSYLDDFEKQFYKLPPFLKSANPYLEKASILCHYEDVFKLKQLLLYSAIDEHLEQMRLTPTDFEVHTSLANTYVMLSKFYQEGGKLEQGLLSKIRFKKILKGVEKKFRTATERAIEEFKILEHYAPNDPWVHMQLAKSYQDLALPQEEIKEYETILKLRPLDKEVLFRLGVLYFEQGQNAKGLEIYEELKKSNYKKAEDLVSFYGTYRLYDVLEGR